jgi:hypothetical protein
MKQSQRLTNHVVVSGNGVIGGSNFAIVSPAIAVA